MDVPRDQNGVETWDLQQPPSAAYVGIEPGHNTVIYSTLEGRPVKVLLPQDVVIEADVTTVIFDNFLSPDGVQDPSHMDVKSPAMDTREAMDLLEEYLAQLDIGNEAIARWKDTINGEEDDRASRGGDSTTIGYLEAGVGGRHSPIGDGATISWGIGWYIDESDSNPA